MHYKKYLAIILTGVVGLSPLTAYAAPEEVLTHKPLAVWDYLLPTYDNDGKVMIKSESTFSTTPKDPYAKEYGKPLFVKVYSDQNKDIGISPQIQTELEREWFKGINRISVMSSYSDSAGAESNVIYKLTETGIIIDSKSEAINQNGAYILKIYSSKGGFVKVPLEVQAPAPELRIHPNYQPVVNLDILFELRQFNYAITNPIYEVVLDGKVLKGNCVDYHVVSNLIRLENGGIIKTPGKHQLTVKAKGFKDATLEFLVSESINGYTPPAKDHNTEISKPNSVSKVLSIDALTAATGSSAGGSGGSGGSVMRGAKLIFDFDMIANAYILESLGLATAESKRVVEIWESAAKEAARLKGSDTFYEWGAYKDALMKAALKGENLDFKAYIQNEQAEKWPNRPYEVKYVLNNGLFGDILNFGSIDLKPAPAYQVLKANLTEGLTLNSSAEFIKGIKQVKKAGYTQISNKDYSVSGSALTINPNQLNFGNNTFTIESEGFNPLEVKFTLEKESVQLKLQSPATYGKSVQIIGFGDDYAKRISALSLNGKALLSKAAAGTSGTFEVKGTQLILDASNFTSNGVYLLTVTADGYNTKELSIEVSGGKDPVIETGLRVPNSIYSTATAKEGEAVVINVGGSFSAEDQLYFKALGKAIITIDDAAFTSEKQEVYGSYKLVIQNSERLTPGSHQIVLKAEGYESKTIQLEVKAKPVILKAPALTATAQTDGSVLIQSADPQMSAYLSKVNDVTLNQSWIMSMQYTITNGQLVLPTRLFDKTGNYNLTLKASGYENASLSFTVTLPEKPTPQPEKPTTPEQPKIAASITFDQILSSTGFFGSKKEELVFKMNDNQDPKYLTGLSFKAKLNGKPVSASLFSVKTSNYNKPANEITIDKSYIDSLLINGVNTLEFEQNGYTINQVQFEITK